MSNVAALSDSAELDSMRHIATANVGLTAIRLLDIVLASLALLLVAPLMLLLAGLVMLGDGGPAIFAHKRLGQGGKTFKCLKFRSMHVDSDRRLKAILESDPEARAEWAANHKLKDDPRITWLGGFLRKWSLDELPQLFNILAGEMSIVGPRPIVAAEAHFYGRYINEYYKVRPGLTGLWQVSGRSDVSYRRRVVMDVLYTRNRSLWLDVKIIALTVPAILVARGSY